MGIIPRFKCDLFLLPFPSVSLQAILFSTDIGLPAYTSIPTGVRVIDGLFQGLAARASGFAIVPLTSLAPALQYVVVRCPPTSWLTLLPTLPRFLYVVMMYIAIYPVALSIRSTNVCAHEFLFFACRFVYFFP